jgi:hypothetical protein
MTAPRYHPHVIQGSDEWLAMRCGLLTASEMARIITPSTLKLAGNDKAVAHMWELLAQRVTNFVEPQYVSDDMLRGQVDEIDARALYAKHYAPVEECGFVTCDFDGVTVGYSPDGLVGADGLIECKSRRQRFQVATIATWEVPPEYMLQVQTGLLVTQRQWLDFVSYSGGLPMAVIRAYPDAKTHAAIIEAARRFESQMTELRAAYDRNSDGLQPTERRVEQEMQL